MSKMADYYTKKRMAQEWLEQKIEENKGQTIPLAPLEIKFMRGYGFGRNTLLNMLEPFETLGVITISDKDLTVHKNA